MKRKLTDQQLIDLLVSRITKGSAFILNDDQYKKLHAETRAKVTSMSRDELRAAFPQFMYDVR